MLGQLVLFIEISKKKTFHFIEEFKDIPQKESHKLLFITYFDEKYKELGNFFKLTKVILNLIGKQTKFRK